MTFRQACHNYRNSPKSHRAAPTPTRSEYDVPGGTVIFTSRQFPPYIAIRFDGEKMGARRTYKEAAELLAEYAVADPDGVAGRAAE